MIHAPPGDILSDNKGEFKHTRDSAQPLNSRKKKRTGAMLVLVAVSMVGLMGLLVMALDAGYGFSQRRMGQTAAALG